MVVNANAIRGVGFLGGGADDLISAKGRDSEQLVDYDELVFN